MNPQSVSLADAERWRDFFWARVYKTENCWFWIGATNHAGYGIIKPEDREIRAHRLSWELAFGAIPEGLHVMHSCDIHQCVNPAHLAVGTHSENMHDLKIKGMHVSDSAVFITHCRKGHNYEEVGVWITRHGTRLCKGCWRNRRERKLRLQREKYARERAAARGSRAAGSYN